MSPSSQNACPGLAANPRPEQQINLTDPDSTWMRTRGRHDWEQACNTQAVVDAEGLSRFSPSMSLAARRCRRARVDMGDSEQGRHGTAEESSPIPGYARSDAFAELADAVDPYVADHVADRGQRRYDSRPLRRTTPTRITNPRLVAMSAKTGSPERSIWNLGDEESPPLVYASGLHACVRVPWSHHDLPCSTYHSR